jgi:hypothetical protein
VFTSILVAVDRSEHARAAVRVATDIARPVKRKQSSRRRTLQGTTSSWWARDAGATRPRSCLPTLVTRVVERRNAPRRAASATGGWLVPLGVVTIGSFMALLDTSIVNVRHLADPGGIRRQHDRRAVDLHRLYEWSAGSGLQ